MTSQYETNLWSTHDNIVRLAEPISRCVPWRTQVFKIKGFVCKRFLPSPPPSFNFWLSFHFSRGQTGLSLLRNQIEMLATQAKIYHFFHKKGTPSVYLLLTNGSLQCRLYRVGESLFMFTIVVAIFDFMILWQRLGIVGIATLRFPPLFESFNMVLSRARTFTLLR